MLSRHQTFDQHAPIIVGGVGGSGTRIVAKVLQGAGVDIGSYLNDSLDNVFFARLICQFPHLWSHDKLGPRLRTFTRLYFGWLPLPLDIVRLYRSAKGHKLKWIWLHIRRSYEGRSSHQRYKWWGWKNPRSLYYLSQLSRQFPKCKYVHVIRHGLDMSYSGNTSQFERWAPHFNIDLNGSAPHASKHLDFWVAVNRWVFRQCASCLPGRYYILNFEEFCQNTEVELTKLLAFLAIDPITPIHELSEMVRVPDTAGRYLQHDNVFTESQIQAVRDMGFDVAL